MGALMRTTGAVTGLGAILALLTALGSGPLQAPPAHPGAWAAWAQSSDPALAALALLRLAALGAGWYLVAVTAAAAMARGLAAPNLARAVAWVTVPSVRRLQQALLGVGVAAAVSAAAVPVVALAEPRAGAVQLEMANHPAMAPGHLPGPAAPGHLPGPPPGDSSAADKPAPATWTVAPGEHFWAIAEQVVAGATGRPAEEKEVASYWHALVERNLATLVDRSIAVLVMAFLGAAMWVAFNAVFTDAQGKIATQINSIGG